MAKYRKKPVEVEAWEVRHLLSAAACNWKALPDCIKDGYENGVFVFCPDGLRVKTLEGVMSADIDDMLIRGVHGEFYPCKPDIFEKTYEEVINDASTFRKRR